jgi:hypothetical protein
MHIDVADVDHLSASNRNPSGLYPFAGYVPVDQDMEVRVAIFLEFENSDVLRSCCVPAL